MRATKSFLAGLLALFLAASTSAQELDLVGSVGWEKWTKRLLRVFADEVANNRDAGFSGPLRLVVWATPDPGDFENGFEIGILPLGDLRAGFSIVDVDFLVRYISPPPGLYFTSITLEEHSSRLGWQIVDFENFPDVVNFGGVGQGVATAAGSNGDVFFEGEVAWESVNGRVLLQAAFIANERQTKSGPLRLTLTATAEPYTGGVLQGPILAIKTLPRLKSGFQFAEFSRVAPFRAPAEGVYYTVMTLEERVGRNWIIRDWVAFPDQSIF